ncbi:MAG: cyclin-dependent kinase inhibitor 3 family protein [Myxococcota bacterium]
MTLKLSGGQTLLLDETTRKRYEALGLKVDAHGVIDDASMNAVVGGKKRLEELAKDGVLDLEAAEKLKRTADTLGGAKQHGPQRSNAVTALAMSIDGLSAQLQSESPNVPKISERLQEILGGLDHTLPSPGSLGDLTPHAVEKLSYALQGLNEAAGGFLGQLNEAIPQADKSGQKELAGYLAGLRGDLVALLRFGAAALTEPGHHGSSAPELASDICRGGLSASGCLQLGQGIEWLSSETKLSTDDVAAAIRWYVGKMTEVGFLEPKRLYEAVDAQLAGKQAKTPGGEVLPEIALEDLFKRAMGSIGVFAKALQAADGPPADREALIAMAAGQIKVRSSAAYPLQVAWLKLEAAGIELPGKMGLTLAPGKKQPSLFGYIWDRDLKADMAALKKDGVGMIVPLIENHELETLGIPNLVEAAKAEGMAVRRHPIPDRNTPDPKAFLGLVDEIIVALKAGTNVMTHCKGGLGRAGTISAGVLIRLGVPAEAAIAMVREVRPGAVENEKQEKFLAEFAAAVGPTK